MTEKQVEASTVAQLKKYGIRSIKLAGPHDRGKPDRMFFANGTVVFAEFKAEGKKPTKLQLKWLADLDDLGFTTGWFDSPEIAVDVIFTAINTNNNNKQ